ncbi:NADH-dependent formate dehydrogenase delta subunit FdsD [Methylophilaceae bacterium 11]|jgi:formate dehydrogenase subunit delta|uniref:formate dehydrogenase subunit delta n=1 Tax=Methylotenera sp. 1P/1 TaxID=1131551 RepID=UPI000367A64A|nr:formate dehydrogenase subunit delta [Methylotenera sp. 1P/1]EUJ11469.1 NADH-dependent formate dehydrogenase delta subunit FdsD [Methylophilaceae bacterium 11]
MEIEKLIKMANQIGDFFEAYPDTELAKKDIANHLQRFWNSVMIKSIVAHVKQQQGVGLHPRVIEAIQQHIS